MKKREIAGWIVGAVIAVALTSYIIARISIWLYRMMFQ